MTLPYSRVFGISLALLFALLFLVLYGASSVISAWIPWRIHPALPEEAYLPLLPNWSLIYLSMPLMLFLCVVKLNWMAQWTLFIALLVQLLTACIFFLLLPVELVFSTPQVNGWIKPWFEFATALSMPRNHLPSLHVAFAVTSAIALHPVVRPLQRCMIWLWAILIVASTVLIHEHHLLDVVAGVLLAWNVWRRIPAWATQHNVLQRVRLEWLWCCNQWAFARRHRRYGLISLMIMSYRLYYPQRGTLLLSGYCFLQAVDDIMDGDRSYPSSPTAMADALISAWRQQHFHPDEDLMLMAADCHQRLKCLENGAKATDYLAELINVMHKDYQRAEARAIWTQAALAGQHQATFTLSLDLLLVALESATSAKAVPELVCVLIWCSVMRDLREDIGAGIINIPQSLWQQLVPLTENVPVSDEWLQQMPLQQWMRSEQQQAMRQLDILEEKLSNTRFDKAGHIIVCLFTRSVRRFAEKRFYRLYPWLNVDQEI